MDNNKKEIRIWKKFISLKKKYIAGFLLLLAITVLWIWRYNTGYFLIRPDAYDYAQMGREICNGNGFSTLHIFPRQIPFLDEEGYLEKENWPNLHRYLLPTVSDAFFYKITKDPVKAGVLQSGISFLLSILAFFILATKLTNLNVSIISTIFFAADRLVFSSSYSGMSESLSIFLLLSLFVIAFSGKLMRWNCLTTGIFCGLCYLSRTQLAFLVPLAALYIFMNTQKSKRLIHMVLFLTGFLFIVSPWFIRNIILTGDPTFSFSNSRNLILGTSSTHSDLEMQLDAPIETVQILKEYRSSIAKKALRNIKGVFNLDFWVKNFGQCNFFLLLLFSSFICRRQNNNKMYDLFRKGVVVLIVCDILIVSLAFHWDRFYIHLRPLIYIVGINELFMFFYSFQFSKRLKQAIFFALLLFGIIKLYSNTTIVYEKRWPEVSPAEEKTYVTIKQIATKNTIIMSDVSYKIALHGGCRTVRLPSFPKDLLEINKKYLPIDYVLISRAILENPRARPSLFERYPNYSKFIKSKQFKRKFELMTMLPDGSALYKRLSKKTTKKTKR